MFKLLIELLKAWHGKKVIAKSTSFKVTACSFFNYHPLSVLFFFMLGLGAPEHFVINENVTEGEKSFEAVEHEQESNDL